MAAAQPPTKGEQSPFNNQKHEKANKKNFTAESSADNEHVLQTSAEFTVSNNDFKKYDSRSKEQIAKLKKMIH